MNMLELVGLRKQFGELVAVDDMNLSIREGEIRGLIGPNGSGKTTLFNLITGFVQPTRGKVIFQGHDITGQPPHAIARRGITRTFQLTTLLSEMTVLQNVVIACHLHANMGLFEQFLRTTRARNRETALKQKALDMLEIMGIDSMKDEFCGDLPHGSQRALGLAIALATEPRLLLLDEPITGMNPVEKKDMMDRVRRLLDRGITVMLIEHDMRTVMGTCNKVTVMNFGRKIAEGSPGEITQNREVIEAYLGRGRTSA